MYLNPPFQLLPNGMTGMTVLFMKIKKDRAIRPVILFDFVNNVLVNNDMHTS